MLRPMVTNNSNRPKSAVCSPPKCFTPKNNNKRDRNVTIVNAITGHQVPVSGRDLSRIRKVGNTTKLMDNNVYSVTVGAGISYKTR